MGDERDDAWGNWKSQRTWDADKGGQARDYSDKTWQADDSRSGSQKGKGKGRSKSKDKGQEKSKDPPLPAPPHLPPPLHIPTPPPGPPSLLLLLEAEEMKAEAEEDEEMHCGEPMARAVPEAELEEECRHHLCQLEAMKTEDEEVKAEVEEDEEKHCGEPMAQAWREAELEEECRQYLRQIEAMKTEAEEMKAKARAQLEAKFEQERRIYLVRIEQLEKEKREAGHTESAAMQFAAEDLTALLKDIGKLMDDVLPNSKQSILKILQHIPEIPAHVLRETGIGRVLNVFHKRTTNHEDAALAQCILRKWRASHARTAVAAPSSCRGLGEFTG
eukprot:TRINITY_DN7380_c0_g1_i2.p3 TRINITY_DN7380_c0_g1~~TRINITY_DN7380_c0_g1_i2.p3  ORF type:complete len:331 (+),score=86.04 TRINITY_DN7380_c0_g1_i2:1408-2400(+)